jgi:heme/copper-type cytochrome/quinol oxidase subunit 2
MGAMVVSVVISLIFIYIAVYIVGDDTDANGKKISHSDDTGVKIITVVMRILIIIFIVLLLVGSWNIDKVI